MTSETSMESPVPMDHDAARAALAALRAFVADDGRSEMTAEERSSLELLVSKVEVLDETKFDWAFRYSVNVKGSTRGECVEALERSLARARRDAMLALDEIIPPPEEPDAP